MLRYASTLAEDSIWRESNVPVLTVGDKRILYIHVPKTGGTSVEDLLRSYGGRLTMYAPSRGALPCSPQHFHGDLLQTLFGSRSDSHVDNLQHDFDFVFMTVRHPMSRLLSEYRYQRSVSVRKKVNPIAHTLTFDLWSRYVLMRSKRNPYYSDNHIRPQFEFSVWNPTIFRLEDGLDAVRQRLDKVTGRESSWVARELKVSTNGAGHASRLRSDTRTLIHSYYSQDFDSYGYDVKSDA